MRKAECLPNIFRKIMDRHQMSHLHCMNTLLLVLIWTGIATAQKDCTGVECKQPENCIEEVLEPGECCASCLQHGCTCEGYQYYDCVNVGFINGKVPEGQSYLVDFGSTECSCPKGGGKISCQFMLCPDLPQNCIDAVLPADGCPQCGRIGCVHEDQKYAAGHTFHMPTCKVCHCPNSGGDLMCYQLPDCNESMLTSPNPSDTVELEQHYDDPYSYDQGAPEGDATQVEPPKKKKFYSYSAHMEQESTGQEQSEDYDYLASSVTPPSLTQSISDPARQQQTSTDIPLLNHPEKRSNNANSKVRMNTSTLSTTKVPQRYKMTTTNSILKEEVVATTETAWNAAEVERQNAISHERIEQGETSHFRIKLNVKKDQISKVPKLLDFKESKGDNFPEVKFNPTPSSLIALKEDHNWIAPKQSQTLYHYQPDEDVDPNSVHTTSKLSAALQTPKTRYHKNVSSYGEVETANSAKDLIETCCGAGQQWAIDNNECMEIPVSRTGGDICRIAQKQCCVSYLKENSCIAGMIAAREGDLCGSDESDTCGGSFYKARIYVASLLIQTSLHLDHFKPLVWVFFFFLLSCRASWVGNNF
ncbi:fibulin-2-like isoform X1 [Crotalus tigris]|uniref:fibulin-2-like isoform X1 n=1 Tax=Crotalus tigris TaxID=88082 RepID=UPI00192F6425|nr:fibulin-2-like isoform X1 [Crotalus tigris]XP_039220183.1 fibulin-2-like isoform X1 [Crotalus tigris]XP_039220184.1 fibulin-2-like isoform X1 [Crotalus tigris]XP_039220185.1 fibulin-2-like isoform X1 [Crotalus tigris]XP_039220186.1 fibulin-2-like isoform X1 [Crotalus tigris]